MILIVCTDDRMGLAFNKRRQSRDSAVVMDIVKLANGAPIGMHERSAMLFEGTSANIVTGAGAADCPYYFLEFDKPADFAQKAEKIVMYRWNRHYAADAYFDADMDGFAYGGAMQFAGTSHEKITREVYNVK